MNIFQTLEKTILEIIKKKIKMNSLTVDDIKQVCAFQESYLKDIIESLERFETGPFNNLRDKYFAVPRRQDRIDNQHLILDLKSQLKGKAGMEERNRPFGAALKVAKDYLKIAKEVKQNAGQLIEGKAISIESARMTDVMLLGVLREMDVFTRYTGYLFEYFRLVLSGGVEMVPYRAKYLADNQIVYMEILENVCARANGYSFMAETRAIKRKNADLVLYANGSSFFSFLNPSNYNKDNQQAIGQGIFGLSIFAWIASKWDDWRHAQYKRTKIHKEWLEQEQARLQQILLETDPNSDQAITTEKYLKAYSNKITELDQEIAEYEGDGR